MKKAEWNVIYVAVIGACFVCCERVTGGKVKCEL